MKSKRRKRRKERVRQRASGRRRQSPGEERGGGKVLERRRAGGWNCRKGSEGEAGECEKGEAVIVGERRDDQYLWRGARKSHSVSRMVIAEAKEWREKKIREGGGKRAREGRGEGKEEAKGRRRAGIEWTQGRGTVKMGGKGVVGEWAGMGAIGEWAGEGQLEMAGGRGRGRGEAVGRQQRGGRSVRLARPPGGRPTRRRGRTPQPGRSGGRWELGADSPCRFGSAP